jgi:hypothetical protein
MPYAELADQVGCRAEQPAPSTAAAAGRRRGGRRDEERRGVGITPLCGFQARLGGSGVVAEIARMHRVDFLARTLGRCDVVGTIIARCRGEAHVARERIRAVAGTQAVQTWWQLELIKQR